MRANCGMRNWKRNHEMNSSGVRRKKLFERGSCRMVAAQWACAGLRVDKVAVAQGLLLLDESVQGRIVDAPGPFLLHIRNNWVFIRI